MQYAAQARRIIQGQKRTEKLQQDEMKQIELEQKQQRLRMQKQLVNQAQQEDKIKKSQVLQLLREKEDNEVYSY